MPRQSAFRGTYEPNSRPYVVMVSDAYMSLQGSTSVIACGECKREVNFNHYITQISTEGSVDSPPGSATVSLSIPDTEVNNFYVDDQFIIVPMMEIELYAKGYYTVGGVPQYYKIFWGLVSTVTQSWSNGVTTIQLSCKDILRWWELTNVTVNPAFLDPFGSSSGGYQLFQNQFAGMNPYTIIIALAKEAMGDFSYTTGSFTSFKPEQGPESRVIGAYARDVMAYWQLKFGNIWNSLVLYGTSGQSYTLAGPGGTVDAVQISKKIFEQEAIRQGLEGKQVGLGDANEQFKIHPSEIAAFKIQIDRAGDVEFFQNDTQSKLSIAMTARDQAGYEFYCDPCGDIVFKPPFYNMNVLPNKPVSWIQDFEIIDDSITDSEQEVYTHITSSGNAFGGVTDYGINDEITTPRTGVFDFHLLRRYGWRRLDYQCEWAGNPRKLFFHLMDYLDRVNAKRQNGTITIPMRPELRMGFPVWIPKYDSFFYIQGLSHQFAPGGQATTTLTLIAKRSKFIAPDIIGKIQKSGHTKPTGGVPVPDPNDPSLAKLSPEAKKAAFKKVDTSQNTYKIDFPQHAGETSGLTDSGDGNAHGNPIYIRDPSTGKLLGFPNVVMVFTKSHEDKVLGQILQESGSIKGKQTPKTGDQAKGKDGGAAFDYKSVVADNLRRLSGQERGEALAKLRAHRYEAGMTNAGGYDYAWDSGQNFKELGIIAVETVEYGAGLQNPEGATTSKEEFEKIQLQKDTELKDQGIAQSIVVDQAKSYVKTASDAYDAAKKVYDVYLKLTYKGKSVPDNKLTDDDQKQKLLVDQAFAAKDVAIKNLAVEQATLDGYKLGAKKLKLEASLNMMVRPVSDEFGFEVIGHYRYGRGAFIDRGKVKILDSLGGVANKVNIQFAATGGLLTDGPKLKHLGPDAQNFSQIFEEMRPDDYLTGASFDHGDDNKGAPQNFNPTGLNTYVNAVDNTISRAGSAIFVEADSMRRAVTLAELKPTIETGVEEATEKCSCSLSKTAWLSVLPQDVLKEVLNAQTFSRQSSNTSIDGTETFSLSIESSGRVGTDSLVDSKAIGLPDQVTGTSAGGVPFQFNTGSFFSVLNKYLVDRFKVDYTENQKREDEATGSSRGVINPNLDPIEDTNILGDPSSPLFQRAANGDPNAIAALQNQVNFGFGLSEDKLKNFKQAAADGKDRIQKSLADLGASFGALGVKNFIGVSASTTSDSAVAQQNISNAANALKSDPNNPTLQANYNLALVKGQILVNSTSGKNNIVLQRRLDLQNALTQFQQQSNLLAQHPNDPVFKGLFSDAQLALNKAQEALKSAENSPENVDSTILYQPPVGPPTQSSILNSKFFDVEKYGPPVVRTAPK